MNTPNDSSSGLTLSRRDMLRYGALATAGILLGKRPAIADAAVPAVRFPQKAKAVIQIWMWGGPPHLDTFDPKPEAGYDYCGPLNKPIKTNVDGIVISQLLPELAKQADKYSIIRGMTHGSFAHETASYMVQTGHDSSDRLVYPSIGAVVSLLKGYDAGYRGLIPPYVVLTELQGRFSECGFLGPRYQPFATGGDPARQPFAVQGIVTEGISTRRQRERRGLLQRLDTFGQAMGGDPRDRGVQSLRGRGIRHDPGRRRKDFRPCRGRGQDAGLVRQDHVRAILPRCAPAHRARRPLRDDQLQGMGHPQGELPGHEPETARDGQSRCRAPRGPAQRGMLDSTIVWWSGEFGRQPKIDWPAPWNGGRNHWGKVFSAVVAGGGFKGGHIVGASDAKGEELKDRPVYPWDLTGTMDELLGIDPDGTFPRIGDGTSGSRRPSTPASSPADD